MWKKPVVKEAEFKMGNFVEMTEEEMKKSNGAKLAIGTCFTILGYACNLQKGSIGGVCYIAGWK